MKNFIFKSEADFHKIVFNKLDMLLTEQRHQRRDLGLVLRKLEFVLNHLNLQKQVDDYFDDKDDPNTPPIDETSHQTDQSTKADLD